MEALVALVDYVTLVAAAVLVGTLAQVVVAATNVVYHPQPQVPAVVAVEDLELLALQAVVALVYTAKAVAVRQGPAAPHQVKAAVAGAMAVRPLVARSSQGELAAPQVAARVDIEVGTLELAGPAQFELFGQAAHVHSHQQK